MRPRPTTGRAPHRQARAERGSATLEIVVLAPVLLLFVILVIFAGRWALAQQAVQAAASEAARAAAIARSARDQWPDIECVALVHRTGRLELGASSVVAAVSSPHRPQAFDAARFAIDALESEIENIGHPVLLGRVGDDAVQRAQAIQQLLHVLGSPLPQQGCEPFCHRLRDRAEAVQFTVLVCRAGKHHQLA